jgi:ubiquinone/menaquinone biosynthesis C-methylase UbiE
MNLTEAIHLIRPAFVGNMSRQTWADLGCGSGLFTKALATLLGRDSNIYAVDHEDQLIDSKRDIAAIEFMKLNFIDDALPFAALDGILMANSLHYVKDKISFIRKLVHHLAPDGRFIIVEYDTTRANTWVPYPIAFDQLAAVFTELGFRKIQRIGERRSIYRSGKMYACLVERV